MKRSYSGASIGLGSVYEWEGNSEVGKGRMEIIQYQNEVRFYFSF
ncbi:hypothetical protein LEP1GSC088_3342 [Leptospira interrogans str. L1207]|nr:hypothetical protein LEP1GSC088_3342 [Leptospira interrogans str. L1207]